MTAAFTDSIQYMDSTITTMLGVFGLAMILLIGFKVWTDQTDAAIVQVLVDFETTMKEYYPQRWQNDILRPLQQQQQQQVEGSKDTDVAEVLDETDGSNNSKNNNESKERQRQFQLMQLMEELEKKDPAFMRRVRDKMKGRDKV
jgi:hypothetical protein